MLKIPYVLAWIAFIAAGIQAAGFIVNAVFTLVNPSVVKHLWHEADLSDLFNHSTSHFFTLNVVMSIVAVLKATLFYLIIVVLHEKKLNMSQPFNQEAGRFISRISYMTLLIGIFSLSGVRFAEWLVTQGVKMPDITSLTLGGADVWLFMSITLFVIAQIFKRGIEIQTENELTV